jgi:hypothetical protein
MMFTIGLMTMDDFEFLRVLEMVGKWVKEKRRLEGEGDKNGEIKLHFF